LPDYYRSCSLQPWSPWQNTRFFPSYKHSAIPPFLARD
jgi:hypothetical protein